MGLKNVFVLIPVMVVAAHGLHFSALEDKTVGDPWLDGLSAMWKDILQNLETKKDKSPFVNPLDVGMPGSTQATVVNGSLVMRKMPVDHDTIVVLGSSVANGTGAVGQGWADLLIEAVQSRNPKKKLLNLGYYGLTLATADTWWYDSRDFDNASAVIFSMSLGNEAILDMSPAKQKTFVQDWTLQVKGILDHIKAPVFLGGVYPHGNFTSSQEESLQEANRIMKTWNYPFFDFLSQPIDDGSGKWREECQAIVYQDEGVPDWRHPNEEGHYRMFQAITQKQIDMLAGLE